MANSVCHAPPLFSDVKKTDILLTEISDFLKQTIILKSFNSWFFVQFVSSPEHEVLMVSYCDQSMSVVRRPSCVVRRASCVVNNLF